MNTNGKAKFAIVNCILHYYARLNTLLILRASMSKGNMTKNVLSTPDNKQHINTDTYTWLLHVKTTMGHSYICGKCNYISSAQSDPLMGPHQT